ncbi:VOC family protein [Clostridium amazonitimonense]|uniref:VOC family protein n=1 Tax=Clostridium amazonitimonense TaxID=1499689 RepID=UPI000509B24B|nr:VOC family protein [Clostridium amazonitimonense]
MFKRLECVSIYTSDIESSVDFYNSLGLKENWKIERKLNNGSLCTLIGLKFPEKNSSELVLQNDSDLKVMDIEIYVDDVVEAYNNLCKNPNVNWIREPFKTESGHVAVLEAPDKNVFVLVGK